MTRFARALKPLSSRASFPARVLAAACSVTAPGPPNPSVVTAGQATSVRGQLMRRVADERPEGRHVRAASTPTDTVNVSQHPRGVLGARRRLPHATCRGN